MTLHSFPKEGNGIYGSSDSCWYVWFDGKNYGPFETRDEADAAYNSILRDVYDDFEDKGAVYRNDV